jgi:hypothetical protein
LGSPQAGYFCAIIVYADPTFYLLERIVKEQLLKLAVMVTTTDCADNMCQYDCIFSVPYLAGDADILQCLSTTSIIVNYLSIINFFAQIVGFHRTI